jgi:hypothetical protein
VIEDPQLVPACWLARLTLGAPVLFAAGMFVLAGASLKD